MTGEPPRDARGATRAAAGPHAVAGSSAGGSVGASAAWLRAWAAQAERRRVVQDAARAVAWALPVAAGATLALRWAGAPLLASVAACGSLALGAAAWWVRRSRARTPLARVLEARVPTSRNLLATALPLARRAGAVAPTATQAFVLDRAVALARPLDARRLLPIAVAPPALGAAFAAALLVLAARVSPDARLGAGASRDARDGRERSRTAPASGAADVIRALRAEVLSPAYLSRAEERQDEPRRLVVPDGGRVRLRVEAPAADSVLLETGAGVTRLTRAGGGTDGFTTTWPVDGGGVLVVRAHRGEDVARRFVGVTVTPDADPRVRVTVPGRDLVLPRGDTTLRLVIEAEDDHALASLVLRYTRVSGSGERYTFDEGSVPLALARRSPTRWDARVDWALDALALGPGDVVVYRAVATDRRPGAPLAESDAWIAEVATGRGDGAAGFAVDVGELRYALSQQMIVLRIERLLAARDSLGAALTPESLVERARLIAAEQRRVRAEFVFLMGGELNEEVSAGDVMGDLNEHQHAEVEADLSAGRVRNEGRAAVFAAIRAMSRTTVALADTALRPALAQAREAVAQLEVAFSRARFLMRPLAEREAIDPARRLTGALAGVRGTSRPASRPAAGVREASLRAALREVQRIAATPEQPALVASRLEGLAAEVLRAGTADDGVQALALALGDAAAAARRGDAPARRAALDTVATQLTASLARLAPAAAAAARSPRAQRLDDARAGAPAGGRP